MDNRNYCAMTVDMKHSQKITVKDRQEIQEYTVKATELLNRMPFETMERELSFTGGDEMQGLFRSFSDAALCYRLLRKMLFPLPLHVGFGIGAWNVKMKDYGTYYQDGPAYHLARGAVIRAKQDTDAEAVVLTEERNKGEQLSAILNAALRLTERNTDYQNELTVLLECLYPIGMDDRGRMEACAEIPRLMAIRYALSFYRNRFEKSRVQPLLHNSIDPSGVPRMNLYVGMEFDDLFWAQAHPRGAASEVARITGLKRQAVDTALKSANVYHERALILTLMMLSQQPRDPR